MKKTFEAKIKWFSEAEGGRRKLPTGNKYAPIIKLSEIMEESRDSWSIVVVNKEFFSAQETLSEIRYLSDEAPDNLKSDLEFCLFEGRKKVAQGLILREID